MKFYIFNNYNPIKCIPIPIKKIPSRSSKLLTILIHTFHLNRTEFISVCLFKYEFQRWFRYQFVCCPWNNIKCVYSLNEFIDCCDVCVTHKTANVPGSQPFGQLANISEYVNKQAIVRGGVLFTRFKCYAYVTPCVIHSMGRITIYIDVHIAAPGSRQHHAWFCCFWCIHCSHCRDMK